MGENSQKSALLTFLQFVRVRAAHQPHVTYRRLFLLKKWSIVSGWSKRKSRKTLQCLWCQQWRFSDRRGIPQGMQKRYWNDEAFRQAVQLSYGRNGWVNSRKIESKEMFFWTFITLYTRSKKIHPFTSVWHEIGVIWANITHVKSHTTALEFWFQSDKLQIWPQIFLEPRMYSASFERSDSYLFGARSLRLWYDF